MNNEVKIINTDEGLNNKCPHCGGTDITFNSSIGKLFCNTCKSSLEPNLLNDIKDLNISGENVIGSGARDIKSDFNNLVTIKCMNCGAEVIIDTNVATQVRCPWCRSMLSITNRIENGVVPDAILPFLVSREEAMQEIKKFANKRLFFARRRFKKDFCVENVLGVYFPYMIVDAKAKCEYSGKAERKSVWYNTKYDIESYDVSRKFDIDINSLAVEACNSILSKSENETNNIINAIMPFDTNNCVKFTPSYLSYFTFEKRDINISDLKNKIDLELKDIARHSINNTLTYYDRGVCWGNEDVKIESTRWVSAYLPVWVYSYYEKKTDKLHYIAVNGRTKKVMGSIPFNKTRAVIVSSLCGIAVFILILPLILIIGKFLLDFADFYPMFFAIILLFVGLSAFKVYSDIYNKYTNTYERYRYEIETKNTVTNLVSNYVLKEKKCGISSSYINGCNNYLVRGNRCPVNKSNKKNL